MSEKVVDLWPSVNCMSRKPMGKTQSATFGTDFSLIFTPDSEFSIVYQIKPFLNFSRNAFSVTIFFGTIQQL